MSREPIKTGLPKEWKGLSFWCISYIKEDHKSCPYDGLRNPLEIGCACSCHDRCYHRKIVRGINEAWCEDCNESMPQYR